MPLQQLGNAFKAEECAIWIGCLDDAVGHEEQRIASAQSEWRSRELAVRDDPDWESSFHLDLNAIEVRG